jgi:hypothetical protein
VWAVVDRESPAWDVAANDRSVFFAVAGLLDGMNLEDASLLWTHSPSGNVVAVETF